jgi:hypothetical protein
MGTYGPARAVRISLLLMVTLILGSCEDGTPEVLTSQRVVSPDFAYDAVIEEVHNGLGLGAGAIYSEIHVVPHAQNVMDHGGPSNSVVFYLALGGDHDVRTTAKWRSATSLIIAYDARLGTPMKRPPRSPVAISYVPN